MATIYADKSSYMYREAATTNYSTSEYVYGSSQSNIRRKSVLLHFDLSAYKSISAASLSIYASVPYGYGNYAWYLRRCIRDVNYSQVTWNQWQSGSNWTTAGGQGAETDYTESDGVNSGLGPGDGWATYSCLAIVQDLLVNAGQSIWMADAPATDGLRQETVWSAVHSDPTKRPYLTVTGVLKPTGGFFSCGGMGFGKRL